MGVEINKYVHVSKKVCLCAQPNVNKKCALNSNWQLLMPQMVL